MERPLSDAAVTVLSVVENSTKMIRASTARVDQPLAALQAKTTEVMDGSQQLSENVTDKGLIMVLLPEQREQQLVETAGSVLDTYNEIREILTKGLDLYRTIDRMPFISLPGLNEDQAEKIEATVAKTQSLAETLRSEIADFRGGVAGAIGKVEATANLLNNEIIRVREALSQLDSRLAELESLSIRLQQVIPGILIAMAVIISLILAFLIFTQVEVIRLYVSRWRLLRQPPGSSLADTPAQPAQVEEAGPEI